jgi:hypothetical protein
MNLIKEITKEIINQADQNASSVMIYDFNEDDNTIFCNLLDADGNTIANRRVFSFYNFPCHAFNTGEKEFIKGKTPSNEWYVEEIKLWLDSKEIEYESNALKSELIELVEANNGTDNQ